MMPRTSLRPSASLLLAVAAWTLASLRADDSLPSLPYAQAPLVDRNGHEWNIDPNGNIQRAGNEPSLISNGAVLMLGNQQFYCQQPLVSPDGESLEMRGPKPYNGISVTRRLRWLNRQGGVVWADEFANATGREVRTTIEIRHHFSGQIKTLVTDGGRASPSSLQPGEGGLVVVPAQEDGTIPAVVVSITGTRGASPPRLALRNSYQLSVFHSLSIPPASSVTLVHATAQVDLNGDTATETLTRKFTPWQLKRVARLLPKPWIRNAANLSQSSLVTTLNEWFPASSVWGIDRETSDTLALGPESLLKGRAIVENLTLDHPFGRLPIDWTAVVAVEGPGSERSWTTRLWLADGQILSGNLSADTARFELLSGASIPLRWDRMDRLVRGLTHGPPPGLPSAPPFGLVETWDGERFAVTPGGSLAMMSRWGALDIPWDSVIAWTAGDEADLPPMLVLQNGTRIRALATAGPIEVRTAAFGNQSIPGTHLRQAIRPAALAASPVDEVEPVESHLDLTGDQRLVAQVVDPSVTASTPAGPLNVAPAEIREWTDITEDREEEFGGLPPQRWHRLELWGGGTVTGHIQNATVNVEAFGRQWPLPLRDIHRFANPIPRIEENVMRRVADLIRQLGNPDWKKREAASAELGDLGPLATGSLREGLRHTTDPEVIRRIETLLQPDS